MKANLNPPVAKRVDRVRTIHGETVIDPYAWLDDKSDPEVIALLEAQNEYTSAVLAPT